MVDISDLLPILQQKTGEGKLNWQISSGSDVYVRLGDILVELDETTDDNFDNVYRIVIRDHEGRIVDLALFHIDDESGRIAGKILRSAQRKALKVDETLLELQSRLSKL